MSHIREIVKQYIQGVAHLFDFAGALYPHPTPVTYQHDIGEALASDWQAIAHDMQKAMSRYSGEYIEGHK